MKGNVGKIEQVELMNSLAFFYRTSGYTGRALLLLLAAHELDPHDQDVQINLAYVLLLNAEPKQALSVLRRCLTDGANRFTADDPIHLLHARILWALGQKDEARAAFRQFTSARRRQRPIEEAA